jgi:hypothetical protein
VPGCSTSDTYFLLFGCAGGIATAAEGTAYGIVADADVGSSAGILEGDCLNLRAPRGG